MKKISLLLCTLSILNINVYAISGKVEHATLTNFNGVLYIFAKGYNSKRPMPTAVLRIENPKFPINYHLTKANVMIPDTPFVGPFTVTARLSKTGGVMDKSGGEASTTEAIKADQKDVNLKLK